MGTWVSCLVVPGPATGQQGLVPDQLWGEEGWGEAQESPDCVHFCPVDLRAGVRPCVRSEAGLGAALGGLSVPCIFCPPQSPW